MLFSILKWPELGPKRGPREQRDCWKVSDSERMRWGTLLGQGPGDVGGRNTRAHTLRGPGVENRLGTGSRSYMDLAAAQQASLKRKGLSVGLVR